MNFSSIRVVLVATSHPGNIGSTARALKTMGLDKLYLVNPKSFPDRKANEMAAGADDLLDSAQLCDSLTEALQGCHLVIGTSARPRGLDLPCLMPFECAELVNQQSDTTQVAIVFGREHAGLTNEELMHCHYHVTIPSNPEYSSLNLSQAVQIIAYELRVRCLNQDKPEAPPQKTLATMDETEHFYEHLTEVMRGISFLKVKSPGKVIERVRRLFMRTRLEKMEVAILRGFLSHIQKALSATKNEKD
jgi:tRNA (cytidine32/uridine32-2'-O)-methyltransferase